MENALHAEIAKIAYELYEKSGCAPGRETLNWLEAERIVLARQGAKAEQTPPAKQQKAPAKRKK